MKLQKLYILLLAGCFITDMSSCNKKQNDAQKAADTSAKAAVQQNIAAAGSTKSPGVAVPAKTLASFLPAVSGYTPKGNPETMEMDFQGSKYSHASQNYENGNKNITVTISDFNYITGLASAYTNLSKINLETDNVSMHSQQFNGNPGWVHWNKKSAEATIGIIVGDRIYVVLTSEHGATSDELASIAGTINYSGIASAAK